MLNEIQHLLAARGAMSVTELSQALQLDASALHPMLELLQSKGRIEKLPLPCGSGCSSCHCANRDEMTYFKAILTHKK